MFSRLVAMLAVFLALLPAVLADDRQFITTQDSEGNTIWLADDRKPALYTDNFGSCLDQGLVEITRFDAALYADNMTLNFEFAGNTNLTRDSVVIYIGVFAYGESRFELPFNPCGTDMFSMCPMQSSVPIMASGRIPLVASDLDVIPSIAYSIPDFEGQAILRIFSNTTQSQIACYSAVVTNGATFSQPAAVGSILGIFAFVAIVASFLTAVYGSDIPTMRTHYAHSLSVLVVFSVYQHIYFTGALSMNWPSVLPAFWSNYAWAAGIINTKSMQDSFDTLTNKDRGNTTMLGAAGTGTWAVNVGGGFDIHSIYKRSRYNWAPELMKRAQDMLLKRQASESSGASVTRDTKYQGYLVRDGLPLPGNYSGFPGTLYGEEVPASNAFLTALVWFLIMLLIVAGLVLGFKLAVEGLAKVGKLKTQRLNFFRSHYLGYLAAAVLRTCFISFFAMMFYTIFQFSYGGVPAVMAIAGIVFVIFFIGIFGIVGYACYFKLRFDTVDSIRARYERVTVLKVMPWYQRKEAIIPQMQGTEITPTEEKKLGMDGKLAASDDKLAQKDSAAPWPLIEAQRSVHDDEAFTKRFGWLASRFRKSKWWFFAAWVVYEFIRACFYAGASGHAMVQVFGLLVVEFIALMFVITVRPFEGQRLNIVMVYLLGFSKVATVALSAAFDVEFNIGRIITTAIGIIIIVIQGLLTIALMVCIVLSAITSYFSVMRYREEIKPKGWNKYRTRYFKHIDQRVKDRPPTPPPVLPTPPPEEPKGPYFSINSVRRAPKIEDEDPEFLADITQDPRMSMDPGASRTSFGGMNNERPYSQAEGSQSRHSRAMSLTSRKSMSGLPYAARVHRGSWSTRDFSEYLEGMQGGAAVSTTPMGDSEGARPLSRSYMVPARTSQDSLARPYPIDTTWRSRPASANYAEQVGREQDPVSPVSYHSAHASPAISRSSSFTKKDNPRASAEVPAEGSASYVDGRRPLSPINTAISRGVDGLSPPPSPTPGSPRRTRSKLQRHRRGDSINEE